MKIEYNDTVWKNGITRVNAKNMNNIETGIKKLYDFALEMSQFKSGKGIKINGSEEIGGNIEISQNIQIVNVLPETLDQNTIYYKIDVSRNLEQINIGSEVIYINTGSGGGSNANVGYLVCSSNASDEIKIVNAPNFVLNTETRLLVKMEHENEADTVGLRIGDTTISELLYNGKTVTSENTWNAGDVLDIYFDGEVYRAQNLESLYSFINAGEGDLQFSDEEGNVLARFENGHIKTKHFNSENANSVIGISKSEYSGIFRNSSGLISLMNDTYFLIPEKNTPIFIESGNIQSINVQNYIEEEYLDVADGDLFTLYVNYISGSEKFEIKRISESIPNNCFPVAKILYWYNTLETSFTVSIVFTIPND